MPYLSRTYAEHTQCNECSMFIHDCNWQSHIDRHEFARVSHVVASARIQKLLADAELVLARC